MNYISLTKFLNHYYNVNNPKMHLLTHKDVKEILPFIEQTAYCNEIDRISRGQIIPVIDSKNKIAFYKAPVLEVNESILEDVVLMEKTKKEQKHYDLEILSIWELRELRSVYKRYRSYRRNIERELIARGYQKSHKKKMIEEIRKESIMKEEEI